MKGTLGVQMFAALCFAQEGSTWLCGHERFASLCLDLTGQWAAGAKVCFISTSITTLSCVDPQCTVRPHGGVSVACWG